MGLTGALRRMGAIMVRVPVYVIRRNYRILIVLSIIMGFSTAIQSGRLSLPEAITRHPQSLLIVLGFVGASVVALRCSSSYNLQKRIEVQWGNEGYV